MSTHLPNLPSLQKTSSSASSAAATTKNSLSLYKKMLGFAALMLVFTGAVAIFAYVERSAMQERNDAHRLQVLIHKTEERKTLFLFRRQASDAQEAEQCVAEFISLANRYAGEPTVDSLKAQMYEYASVFRLLIPKMIARGYDENTGAEGMLRASVHQIETIVRVTGLTRLEADMLSARRSEKDFLLRRNKHYIQKTLDAVATLKTHTLASSLTLSEKQRIVELADNYLTNFERAATLIAEMESLSEDLSARFARMLAVTERFVQSRDVRSKEVEQRMMFSLALAIILSVASALWLAHKLASPIVTLKNAANEMAVGVYIGEVHVHTRDEVQELAAAFNLMVRRIRERTHDLQQSNLELREANRHIHHQNRILGEQASEIELVNSELQEINERLKAANQEKNEFLGIAAHDLKNPLSGIKMLSKILQEQSDSLTPEDIRDMTGEILLSSARMFDLITNLLDVNALETGGVVLKPNHFDVDELLSAIGESYQDAARTKSITIHHTPPHEPLVVYADMTATRQVLDNLISNAVKYSPHGKSVHLMGYALGDAAVVSVRDEGPGLTDDDKRQLFGKFTRLSARPTGGEHSTGLGLSIVKTLVDRMGGRVRCESEQGKGATFVVELPLAKLYALPMNGVASSLTSETEAQG
jgi:signal transduction histidine kinase